MSRGGDRLTRIARGLDARERVLLLHHALIEHRVPDPQIRATTPPHQYEEFNRYVTLSNGVLHTLVLLSHSLAADVEGHRMRQSALLALAGWGLDRPRRRRAPARRPSPPAELFPVTAPPAIALDAESSLDDVARAHAWYQRCEITQSWPELRAIEVVLEEVRQEFGGAEVAPESLVERLRWSREQLLSLCEEGEPFTGAIELHEPVEEMLVPLRAAVRRDESLYV